MADYVFNIAKGRIVEYYNRVKGNDPAASRLVLVPLATQLAAAAGSYDYDTLALAISGGNVEAGGSWGRKSLQDTDLVALPAPDDANERFDISLPQVTWTAPTAGQNTQGLMVCYDPAAASADTAIIPLTSHTFTVTADGNDVILNAGVFFRAS